MSGIEDHDEILWRSLDGLLSPEEEAELSRRLEADARLAERLAELAWHETMLGEGFRRVSDPSRRGAEKRAGGRPRTRRFSSKDRTLRILTLPVTVAASFFLLFTLRPAEDPQRPGRAANPPGPLASSGGSKTHSSLERHPGAIWEDINGEIQAYVEACLRGEKKRSLEIGERLTRYGTAGLRAVQAALGESLPVLEAGQASDGAPLGNVRSLRQTPDLSPGSLSLESGAGWPPEMWNQPWVRREILYRLAICLHFHHREPLLATPVSAMLSFEYLAGREDWEAAARCLERPDEATARRLYRALASIREASDRPSRWEEVRLPGKAPFLLLADAVYAPLAIRSFDGGWRFTHTDAIARFSQRNPKGKYLLSDVIKGDSLKNE